MGWDSGGYNHQNSMFLIGLLFVHRSAFDYDLRKLGTNVTAVMSGDLSWNEAAGLAAEILRDPYSHCSAAAAGWAFVPDPSDVHFLNWVDVTASMHHQSGKVRPRPVERPWTRAPAKEPTAASPERLKRRAVLRERLGLSH